MKQPIKFIIFIVFTIFIMLSSIDVDYIQPLENKVTTPVKMQEKDYVNKYCTGIKEYVLPDKTRIDCLTEEYAIEFDYAKKWAESIGQSLYYAKKTGKKPAVAIITDGTNDKKYIERIKEAVENITIFEIPAFEYNISNDNT